MNQTQTPVVNETHIPRVNGIQTPLMSEMQIPWENTRGGVFPISSILGAASNPTVFPENPLCCLKYSPCPACAGFQHLRQGISARLCGAAVFCSFRTTLNCWFSVAISQALRYNRMICRSRTVLKIRLSFRATAPCCWTCTRPVPTSAADGCLSECVV